MLKKWFEWVKEVVAHFVERHQQLSQLYQLEELRANLDQILSDLDEVESIQSGVETKNPKLVDLADQLEQSLGGVFDQLILALVEADNPDSESAPTLSEGPPNSFFLAPLDAPDWYKWGLTHRPFPTPASTAEGAETGALRRPFQKNRLEIDSWSDDQLFEFIALQLGLELPDDLSKVYMTWEGPEYGPVDLTDQLAKQLTGQAGADRLHMALLIICGAMVVTTHAPREQAAIAANLIYYLATGSCLGGSHPLEIKIEAGARQLIQQGTIRSLQDATFFVFHALDLPHPASVEFVKLDHLQIWGW